MGPLQTAGTCAGVPPVCHPIPPAETFERIQDTAAWALTPQHLEDFCSLWSEYDDGRNAIDPKVRKSGDSGASTGLCGLRYHMAGSTSLARPAPANCCRRTWSSCCAACRRRWGWGPEPPRAMSCALCSGGAGAGM